jgi:hypothetical protein
MKPDYCSAQFRNMVVISCAVFLAVAALVNVVGESLRSEQTFHSRLTDLLPSVEEIPEWRVSHRPVAETREMKKAVSELLNYEEACLVDFKSGDSRVSLYSAYWPPGRMSHRVIAGHTPDVCWVESGWENMPAVAKSADFVVDGSFFPPLEHRVFRLRGQSEHVVFLHLVGGRPMNYGTSWKPPWYALFADVLGRGLKQREEQFFLRISSNRPWEEFREAAPVQIFLRRFAAVLPGKAGA